MPTDIRITDPYLIEQVEAVRAKRGDSTATKTAGRLIVERITQLELIGARPSDKHPSPTQSAGDTRTGATAQLKAS